MSEYEILTLLYCPQRHQRQFQRDQRSPYKRLNSRRYQAKKGVVRSIWIATGLMMISFPLLPFVVTLGLFTTFLSFCILDESA